MTGARSPSVLFLGMTGRFSLSPLEALLAAGIPVRAIVLPGTGSEAILVRRRPAAAAGQLPVLVPPVERTIVHVAWDTHIPVFEVTGLSAPETLQSLSEPRPDVVAVACFPRIIPAAFRSLARLAALNVHPSLLPANRGPDPLFWTFRLGEQETGVTVHLLEDRPDAGPILEQARLAVPDGIDGAELERQCARLAGELLVRAVESLGNQTAHPVTQDEGKASYHPAPAGDDFLVAPERPARWAFNFIQGVRCRGGPLRIRAGGGGLGIARAIGFDETAELGAPWRREGSRLSVQCNPGVLIVDLEE